MADKEYIEREALLYEIDKCEPMNWTGSDAENQADLDHGLYRGLVADAPTADVVEVRHGEWKSDWGSYYPCCSECGEQPRSGYMEKYCPNCGAKMDGKGGSNDEVR